LYPHLGSYPNVLAGSKWFLLRDEFIYTERRPVSFRAERLLVTFGASTKGSHRSDPGNRRAAFRRTGHDDRRRRRASYAHADHLDDADLRARRAFPVFDDPRHGRYGKDFGPHACSRPSRSLPAVARFSELASLAVPTIVICQNQRELTQHFRRGGTRVICNLGWHRLLEDERIGSTVASLLDDPNVGA